MKTYEHESIHTRTFARIYGHNFHVILVHAWCASNVTEKL